MRTLMLFLALVIAATGPASSQDDPSASLGQMQQSIAAHNYKAAFYQGKFAVFQAQLLSDELERSIGQQETTLFWGMLSKDERKVIATYGGTSTDNRDARPSEWKSGDDPDTDIWIYKQDGAVRKVYTFHKGKLISAIAP